MSILIKGIEMPTSCYDCPFMYGRRYCRANSKIEFNDPDYSELKGRYDGCPLIPVPSHGNLIDVEAPLRFEVTVDAKMNHATVDIIAPSVMEADWSET